MKQFTDLSYRFYVSIIYFIMGILYLFYTGISLPGSVDNFFHRNHHFLIFIIACGYFTLSILYLYNQNVYKLEVEETNNQKNTKRAIVCVILGILLYYLYKILKTLH